jgi:hypothetical protein
MAYPAVSGPYGLRPVNEIGGLPFAGSTRMVPIASGYTTTVSGGGLFYGDPVKLTTTGTLIKSSLAYNTAATETGGTYGIFLGCEYSSTAGPIYGKNRYSYWANGTVASDAVAYVCDDPNVVMKAAVISYSTSASTTVGYINPLFFGTNCSIQNPDGVNTGTLGNLVGNSNVGLSFGASGARVTSTAPFRVVQLVPDTVVSLAATANTASSTAMTLTTSNSSILPGMIVTGSGIPTNTYVTAVSGTAVTLSAAATSSLTAATFTFTGYTEALVKWNFGYHAYQNAAAI